MACRLEGKVVIVTGSSSGIGETIALTFASEGAKVTLCGRDKDKLKSVLDKVVKVSGGHKERFITVAGDLLDQGVRKETIDQTVRTFGRLDVLIANAGIIEMNLSVHNATEKSYNSVMDTNVKSVFFLMQQAVPHLEKSKGNIVIISSSLSTVAWPPLAVYCMAKAALDHMTSCLAVDLGNKKIRVNSVLPGYVPTNALRCAGEYMEAVMSASAKEHDAKQPLKEKVLTVNDIAETVSFLASDAAGCITGEHIKVDGGMSFAGYPDPEILMKE